jgi:hypothetical protein
MRQFEDGHNMRSPRQVALTTMNAINRHGTRIEESDLAIVFEMMHGPGHEVDGFFKRDWDKQIAEVPPDH